MKTINDELYKLYSQNWGTLLNELNGIDDAKPIASAYPLLLSINEEKYENADVRLMVFGKEPNVWGYEDKIDVLMRDYYEFTNSNENFNVKYRSFFWNGVKQIFKMIQEKYAKKNVYLIYNNLIKIGKLEGAGRPPEYIYEIEKKHFSVIKQEVEILKPNIILCLSGTNYDNIINDIWGEIKYTALHPFKEEELAQIDIPNVNYAFRTEHPQTLCSWGKETKDKCFSRIIEQLPQKF